MMALLNTRTDLTVTLTTAEKISTVKEKKERNARQPAAADWACHPKRSADSHAQLSSSMSQLITILSRLKQVDNYW